MAIVSSHRVTVGKTASSNSRMFLIGTFLILAGNDDMHESLDEFEIWPDSTIDYGVSCLSAYEKKKPNRLIIGKTVSLLFSLIFLAHLSQRLLGELIVYPWSGVRRRRPYIVRYPQCLKHLLLQNCLADQSQILCGASLARGYEILFATCGSHDQDGRHAKIYGKKPFKNLLFRNRRTGFHESWYVASGTPAHHCLFK